MKKFNKVVSAALCTAMVAGCFATGVSADEEPTWKIGGIGPVTGAASAYGSAVMNAVQLAVDEINEAGGINGYQVEFNAQDDEHDAEKSVNAYNTLKDWGMQMLIGTVTTAPCQAVGPEAAADGMFMITPSASAEDCISYGDTLFRMCFTDPQQGVSAADYIGENLDVSSVAIIYDASDVYSTGIHDTFIAESENYDFEIVADSAFTADSNTDFSAQIQAAQDAGAELVFLPFYYNEASIVFTQAASMGYEPTWVGVDGMDGILSVEGFDTSLAEGVILLTPFSAVAEENQEFVTAYEELYGETPNQFAADGYDCVYAIKLALEETDLTPEADFTEIADQIKVAFTEITLEGRTGTSTWTADGEVSKAPTAVVIEDGAYAALQ